MIKIGNKRVARIYLGKSNKAAYFVGQLVPLMQKIDDPRFLLCDGSAHTWTATQTAVLPASITSSNVAPNLQGRTVMSSNANIGTTVNNTVLRHNHNAHRVEGSNSVSLATKNIKKAAVSAYFGSSNLEGISAASAYYGEATGNTSKRTYVYWYLYIGDE